MAASWAWQHKKYKVHLEHPIVSEMDLLKDKQDKAKDSSRWWEYVKGIWRPTERAHSGQVDTVTVKWLNKYWFKSAYWFDTVSDTNKWLDRF